MSDRDDLLALLGENARYSTTDLARMTDFADEAAVAAAIEDLEAEGVVQGYQAVVDRRKLDPEPVRALVELNVMLDRETGYEEIADRLAKFPQVVSLRLMSGDYDFALDVEDDSMGDVSRFVSEKVAPVPEVSQTVTHYVMNTYKEGGLRLDDGREDDRLSVSP